MISDERAGGELVLDRDARLERQPEPEPHRLLDRAVRAERQGLRAQVVVGEELGDELARSRAGLAHQPHPLRELLGPHGLRAGELVAGSRDQRDRVLEEGVPGDPLVLGRPAGDRHVDLVLEHAVEDRGAVRDLEREVDLRVHRGEGAQQRGDDELGGGRDGDDAQRAHRDVRGLACSLLPLLDQPEDVGGVRTERVARGGQPDAAPDALGQVDPELARESRDSCGDRRLRDVELLGRGGDGALTGDREEARKLIQGDGHRRIII